MADGKIELSIGAIKFAGEGDTKWLTEQLDKLLSKAEARSKMQAKLESVTLPTHLIKIATKVTVKKTEKTFSLPKKVANL